MKALPWCAAALVALGIAEGAPMDTRKAAESAQARETPAMPPPAMTTSNR